MFGSAVPFIMSFSAMAFAAASALVLIRYIRSLDPPETPRAASHQDKFAA